MEKEKKKPRLESWSFYSNSHDFHMLLIVVPTWSVSDSLQPHGLPGSSVHGILQARILEWVAISFFRGSSRPRDQTRVSCTADRVFTNWAMREAQSESESDSVLSDSATHSPWNSPGQNIGVSSLSLLQGIFSTQGSNPDLPHCRQILHQLSHKGNPCKCNIVINEQSCVFIIKSLSISVF